MGFEHMDWLMASESFFVLRELGWVGRGFNQQRFFTGARIPLRTRLHLEAGYHRPSGSTPWAPATG